VAELAYAPGLGPGGLRPVGVQVPPPASQSQRQISPLQSDGRKFLRDHIFNAFSATLAAVRLNAGYFHGMATIPVICDDPNCGTLWGSTNFIGGEASGVILAGNKVGPCPRCGGVGSVPDGEFDLIEDTLEVVRSADLPRDVLQQLIDVMQAHASGNASDADVIEQVESTAPSLASVVRDYLAKSDPASWLTLLVTILLAMTQPTAPSAQDIAKEIWANKPHAVKQSRPHAAKPKGKRPAKSVGKAKQPKSRKRR
jgi:hypothetical protein